jgi:hypothetical protein
MRTNSARIIFQQDHMWINSSRTSGTRVSCSTTVRDRQPKDHPAAPQPVCGQAAQGSSDTPSHVVKLLKNHTAAPSAHVDMQLKDRLAAPPDEGKQLKINLQHHYMWTSSSGSSCSTTTGEQAAQGSFRSITSFEQAAQESTWSTNHRWTSSSKIILQHNHM